MSEADLPLLAGWLARPHVARWWYEDAALPAVRQRYLPAIRGEEPTRLVIAELHGHPVGFAQWYAWDDEPEAPQYGALPGEVGIDYALGEPDVCGRGVGTALIAVLVDEVRAHRPAASILTSPEQANVASCRVLEKNGFHLIDVRRIDAEPGDGPAALYRLSPG